MRKRIISGINAIVFFMLFVCTFGLVSPGKVQAATIVKSEAYNWNNVRMVGTGYIPGVIFNTSEKDLIYARTDMGGAYRWNPANSTWTPLLDWVGFDDWNYTGCESIATDPVDPNRVYIAAGTYVNNWTSLNGCILRSTDKGNTWQKTDLPFKLGGNHPGRGMGERLVIDPNDNRILYLGTRCGNGLWRSTDYGVTWSKVTSFPNPGNYVSDPSTDYGKDIIGVVWEAFDATTGSKGKATQTMYVGVADKKNSIYCTNDGGTTWQAVPNQPTGFLPHHGVLASNGVLYISYSDTCGPYDGSKGDVWKYDTKTKVWTNISPVPSTNSEQYYGYGGLSVDAKNPNTLMVTAIASWWPDGQIYRSTDGGATWKAAWEWNGYPTRKFNYTQDISAAPWLDWATTKSLPEVTPKLGWMLDDIKIDPFNSNRMFYGTGATLYGCDNLTDLDKGGKMNIRVMASGIEEAAALALISPPSGAQLLAGVGDVSGFRYEDVTKTPTKMFTDPSFTTTGMDYAELNPKFIVRVGNPDSNYPNQKCSSYSYDGGVNWFSGNKDVASGISNGGQVAAAADASAVLWSPTGGAAGISKDNGNSWTLSAGVPVGASVASDRVNAKKFYAFSAGKFYVSADGGVTFAQTTATGLPQTGTGFIKAVPGREGDIWLVGGSQTEGLYGMWHSTDSGASFTKLANVDEADTVGFGKAAPGQAYMAIYTSAKIGGVRGIFRSNDMGATWVRINDDQHQYGCTNACITGDPRIYGRVYIGTNGRGVIYGDTTVTPTDTNASITPVTAAFDKNTEKQANIAVTVNPNGNTLTAVKNGDTALVAGTDYTVANNIVTILKSYLAKQKVGTTSLTFDFSQGTDPVLAITLTDSTPVNNSTITPVAATFDKNVAKQADLSVTMKLNGNTLTAVKNGETSLVAGTDYTVANDTVTILKGYLANQKVGATNLTFDFSGGNDPVLAVTVTDSTPTNNSSINPTSAIFDKNVSKQADLLVNMTLNGNTLNGISSPVAALVYGKDYTIAGDTVNILKGYLGTQAFGTLNLTFDFSSGVDPVLPVTITDSSVVAGNLKVQMYTGNTAATSSSINPMIRLVNSGTTVIDLSTVKVRYYFTVNGDKDQNYWCDWSSIGSSNVSGSFVKMTSPKATADYYFEVGFTSGAGMLMPGKSEDVQIRISKVDWTSYNQADDYSLNATAKTFVDWSNVTAYIAGVLQWGVEP